jgi:hypothetical protein
MAMEAVVSVSDKEMEWRPRRNASIPRRGSREVSREKNAVSDRLQ